MSMKRLMVIAALAVAPLASCVANQGDTPIRFLNARGLEFEPAEGCTANEDTFISQGDFDSSGGQNYLLAMSVETNTFAQPITIGQEPFSGEGLGDITLEELVYSYKVAPAGIVTLPADEDDRVSLYAVFRPETDPDESYLFVRAFGPKALTQLQNMTVNSPVTVLTTVKARGRLSGGQSVESNKFTFPITVVNSGYVPSTRTCALGGTPNEAGVCTILGQEVRICPAP
jgi:hypothetical protein